MSSVWAVLDAEAVEVQGSVPEPFDLDELMTLFGVFVVEDFTDPVVAEPG